MRKDYYMTEGEAADLCAKSTGEKMKIKFKFYSWRAKFRQKEAPLFRLKAIFHEDSCDVFIHLPLLTVGIVIHEKEEK